MAPSAEKSRIRVVDLADEMTAALVQRPARSILTMLGTVLGLASFVAVLGLTASANGQVDKRFTRLAVTEVIVEDVQEASVAEGRSSFPRHADVLALRVNGVRSAGVRWRVDAANLSVSTAPGTAVGMNGLNLVAADPSVFVAAHVELASGRLFDHFHTEGNHRVAVLGSVAAAQLGISSVDGRRAVFLNGRPYLVLGIIDGSLRLPELMSAVVIPPTTADLDFGPPREERPTMLIETDPGAAPQVAGEISVALRPDMPSSFKVIGPPDPRALRSGVASDLNALFVLLAFLSLIVGAFGIANTTLVAVLERTSEIGLRRALGARAWHVGAQFLAESGALGLMGGLCGAAIGVLVVVVAAYVKSWTAILDIWIVASTPLIGMLVGLIAGCYPAVRAARIEPLEALRR